MERRGAANLLQRLIAAFLDSAGRLVQDVEHALAQDDAPALRQAVHTLKSSSANLGATEFSRQCAELERMARAGRVADGRTAWPQAAQEYQRVVRALAVIDAHEIEQR
jgi:HPt (histidine-containing phosphotransfer) domain-containing protein